MTKHDVYKFDNLQGDREEWLPPLSLTLEEFWHRIETCHAVFIPAAYWRVLSRQGKLLYLVDGATVISSGNYPVGIKNGTHLYTDAFTHTTGFNAPIILVHKGKENDL